MPNINAKRTEPRRFVPDDLDAADAAAVSRLYDLLAERDVSTLDKLEAFILDWEELGASIYEVNTAAYIDMTVDTTNPDYEARYIKILELQELLLRWEVLFEDASAR